MNKFKIGDRVAFYESGIRGKGIITEIDLSGVKQSILVDTCEHWLHPKQCVKLRRKNKLVKVTKQSLANAWNRYIANKYRGFGFAEDSDIFEALCREAGLE